MAAVASATAKIKSQDPAALEKRLTRLRANPDYHYLNRETDAWIAEMKKRLDQYIVTQRSVNESWQDCIEAHRDCRRAHDARRRSEEGFKMKCEEANTYRCMAKAAETVMIEEADKRFLAEFELENLKRKRNPGRTGGGKRGRPKKVAAKSVFVDDELAQLGPPDYSLMEAD